MATTNTWEQVVEKISGVVNRGAFSKTFAPTTSAQSASGAAGYYSSVSTTCNAVSLSGNAGTGQVLSGYTFYNNSLTRQTGTMANRGALNWTPTGSTTYSVPAGYYSGGTLNSGTAYTNGYNAGVTAGKNTYGLKTATGTITAASAGTVTIQLSFQPYGFAAYVDRNSNTNVGTYAGVRGGAWIMQAGTTVKGSHSSSTANGGSNFSFGTNSISIYTNNSAFNGNVLRYTVYGF